MGPAAHDAGEKAGGRRWHVRGIVDQGEDSAGAADERTLVTAQEAHQARFNSYASETELVTAGLLSSVSSAHDINLLAGGDDYEIVGEGMDGIRFRFHYQGETVHVKVPLQSFLPQP